MHWQDHTGRSLCLRSSHHCIPCKGSPPTCGRGVTQGASSTPAGGSVLALGCALCGLVLAVQEVPAACMLQLSPTTVAQDLGRCSGLACCGCRCFCFPIMALCTCKVLAYAAACSALSAFATWLHMLQVLRTRAERSSTHTCQVTQQQGGALGRQDLAGPRQSPSWRRCEG